MGCDPLAVAGAPGEDENRIVGVVDESARLVAAAGVIRSRRKKTRHRATIWGVYTMPALRRRGLGVSVVGAAIETARAWPGVTLIGLSVSERAATRRRRLARSSFSQTYSCPKDRLTITRTAPPADVANDPERTEIWERSHHQFAVAGCGQSAVLSCQSRADRRGNSWVSCGAGVDMMIKTAAGIVIKQMQQMGVDPEQMRQQVKQLQNMAEGVSPE